MDDNPYGRIGFLYFYMIVSLCCCIN